MDRNEFMELVYETFADEPDNVLANGIIEAADAYVEHEKAQLSQQCTTKDTISRTETAEHLRRVLDATVPITDYDEGYVDGVEFGISTVSTMPPAQPEPTDEQVAEYCKRRCLHVVTDDFFHTVQPEPQWISVTERLPDIGMTVLFCDIDGDEFIGHRASDYWWSVDDKVKSVIAWMPLPKPFEGGTE